MASQSTSSRLFPARSCPPLAPTTSLPEYFFPALPPTLLPASGWLLTGGHSCHWGDTLVTWTFIIHTSCLGSIAPPESSHLTLTAHCYCHSCHWGTPFNRGLGGFLALGGWRRTPLTADLLGGAERGSKPEAHDDRERRTEVRERERESRTLKAVSLPPALPFFSAAGAAGDDERPAWGAPRRGVQLVSAAPVIPSSSLRSARVRVRDPLPADDAH